MRQSTAIERGAVTASSGKKKKKEEDHEKEHIRQGEAGYNGTSKSKCRRPEH